MLDLLFFYPRKWNDRTNAVAIEALVPGEEAVVSAEIISVSTKRPRGRKPIVELRLSDGTGTLLVSFFNQPWRARQLAAEMNVVVFGKVDLYRERLQMVNPIVDLVGDQTGRIVPIYPQSEQAGIGSSELGHFVEEALERAGDFADPLPGAPPKRDRPRRSDDRVPSDPCARRHRAEESRPAAPGLRRAVPPAARARA